MLVKFVDAKDVDDVNDLCQSTPVKLLYGCAYVYPPSDPQYPNRPLVLIVTIPPKDFNDWPKILILGHEVLHGRGWQH